jgi:hypothetical protein
MPVRGSAVGRVLVKLHFGEIRTQSAMGSRLTWAQIRRSDEFRGRWVALDSCTYDPRTAQPAEGNPIDADEDLVELCRRLQQCENRHCAIVFCDEAEPEPVSSPTPRPGASGPVRPSDPPFRPYTH